MTMLSFDRACKSYGTLRALDDLTFSVERDEIVAVLGPNGAGKTTALDIALGLRSADSGSVALFGGSPSDARLRRRLGATPQESGFPDTLRVGEIVAFVAQHYPDPASVETTLATFGLSALASRRAGTLSGGQSRRLALALAFAGNPELVVLDEPTAGLDVESRRALWEVVRRYAGGRSVLFTTHYVEEAQELATRVVVIDGGRVRFDGTQDDLRRRFGARRVSYVGDVGRIAVTIPDADAYVRDLVRAGTAFSDLEIVRPSLEEAFLSMTGGSK